MLILSSPPAPTAARPGTGPGARSAQPVAQLAVAGPGTLKYLSRQVSLHQAVSGPPTSSCELSGRPALANVARLSVVMGVMGISSTLAFGPLLASTRSVTSKYV